MREAGLEKTGGVLERRQEGPQSLEEVCISKEQREGKDCERLCKGESECEKGGSSRPHSDVFLPHLVRALLTKQPLFSNLTP